MNVKDGVDGGVTWLTGYFGADVFFLSWAWIHQASSLQRCFHQSKTSRSLFYVIWGGFHLFYTRMFAMNWHSGVPDWFALCPCVQVIRRGLVKNGWHQSWRVPWGRGKAVKTHGNSCVLLSPACPHTSGKAARWNTGAMVITELFLQTSLCPEWLLRVSSDTSQRFRRFPAVMAGWGSYCPSGTIVSGTRAAPNVFLQKREQ